MSKIRRARVGTAHSRKHRKSFSLSGDVVEFLESFREESRQASLTAALESILRERKRQKELEKLSASVSAYYDSMSPEERRDESSWGEFAESQFPAADG